MLSAAIVEDDEKDAGILRRSLEKYASEVGQTVTVHYYPSGRKFLEEYSPELDVVFLDIEMPDLDGMTTARRLRELDRQVRLIFVTNVAKYAVQGYSVGAMDYILKPVRYADIKMRMERVRESLEYQDDTVSIPNQSGVKVLRLQEIVYIESFSHQITVHTRTNDYVTRRSLTEWETALVGKGFARCSNSYIVNLRYVTEVRDNTAVVAGTELQISRSRKQEFVKQLLRNGI